LNVAGTETVAAGQIGFGVLTSYSSRPVVIRSASPGGAGSDQLAVDNLLNGTFAFAYGIADRLQLNAALPVTFWQSGSGVSSISGGLTLPHTALRDVRFGVAWAILPRPRVDLETLAESGARPFAIAARFDVSAPTGDDAAFATDRSGVLAPSVSADYRFKGFLVGAELGARIRSTTSLLGARVGSQARGALGASYDILPKERLTVQGEGNLLFNFPEQQDTFVGSSGIGGANNGRHIFPAEWTVSVRSAPFYAGDIAFIAGGGGPIPIGDTAITTPRFRFTLGVVYAPLGRDSDKDGVLDKQDKCPHEPQVRSFPPRDGCVHRCPPDAAAGTCSEPESSPAEDGPSNKTEPPVGVTQ
jgi:hypothetical protein